jgi:hypothetical protein
MLNKVTISSEQVIGSKKVQLKNIVSLVVSNHSENETTIKVNGINRTLPPVDSDFNTPTAPFVMEACGYVFDIEISVIDAELVVIDYAQHKLTKEC